MIRLKLKSYNSGMAHRKILYLVFAAAVMLVTGHFTFPLIEERAVSASRSSAASKVFETNWPPPGYYNRPPKIIPAPADMTVCATDSDCFITDACGCGWGIVALNTKFNNANMKFKEMLGISKMIRKLCPERCDPILARPVPTRGARPKLRSPMENFKAMCVKRSCLVRPAEPQRKAGL